MKHIAEYVSAGHPDRLADKIADNIVKFVYEKDKYAICQIECAINCGQVFIDGYVCSSITNDERNVIENLDIVNITKKVFKDVGYGYKYLYWHPFPDELNIIVDVKNERMNRNYKQQRRYSDDQCTVIGYANNNEKIDYLPPEQFVALKLGEFMSIRDEESLSLSKYGPDFKLFVDFSKENKHYSWNKLIVSIQTSKYLKYSELYRQVCTHIRKHLIYFEDKLPGLETIASSKILINGAGDYVRGGPEGDNGLTGKKLCIDYYGPNIPIGGGAIYGKDYYKVDVIGARRARDFALALVKNHGFNQVITRLSFAPGDEGPYLKEAYIVDDFGTQIPIDNSLFPDNEWFSIESTFNDWDNKEHNKIYPYLSV